MLFQAAQKDIHSVKCNTSTLSMDTLLSSSEQRSDCQTMVAAAGSNDGDS